MKTQVKMCHLPHPDLQQSTCTVWYESLCKQEQQKAEAQQKPENVFCCTHLKSSKTIFFAFCLTHVIIDMTPKHPFMVFPSVF